MNTQMNKQSTIDPTINKEEIEWDSEGDNADQLYKTETDELNILETDEESLETYLERESELEPYEDAIDPEDDEEDDDYDWPFVD